MKRLIAYEFRKAWLFKVILLGVAAVLELVFLIGLMARSENTILAGALLLLLAAQAGLTLIGIASFVLLHRDMNTRQGYMLFMTPQSCWKILGAKVIENGISELLAGAFFGVLGFLDVTLLFSHYGRLGELWQMIERFLQSMIPGLSTRFDVVAPALLMIVVSWLATVNTAYFADVLASSILRGKGVGGFVAFLFFATLNVLFAWLPSAFIPEGTAVQAVLWIRVAFSAAVSALMYVLSAILMEKKLSV